jgi:hypothetical protein
MRLVEERFTNTISELEQRLAWERMESSQAMQTVLDSAGEHQQATALDLLQAQSVTESSQNVAALAGRLSALEAKLDGVSSSIGGCPATLSSYSLAGHYHMMTGPDEVPAQGNALEARVDDVVRPATGEEGGQPPREPSEGSGQASTSLAVRLDALESNMDLVASTMREEGQVMTDLQVIWRGF